MAKWAAWIGVEDQKSREGEQNPYRNLCLRCLVPPPSPRLENGQPAPLRAEWVWLAVLLCIVCRSWGNMQVSSRTARLVLALARREAPETRMAEASLGVGACGEVVTVRALTQTAHISQNTACRGLRLRETNASRACSRIISCARESF